MKKALPSVITLTLICLIISAVLAIVNSFTAPVIKENDRKNTAKALSVVLPGGKNFEAVDSVINDTITEAYKESDKGYVFKISTQGFDKGLVILVGVDNNGVVTGTSVMASNETLGAEKTYGNSVLGATPDTIDSIATVSGATLTSTAYKNAVKDALAAYKKLSGK